MATKTILKNVDVKDRHSARRLADALEKSSTSKPKSTTIELRVQHVSKDQIKTMFGM